MNIFHSFKIFWLFLITWAVQENLASEYWPSLWSIYILGGQTPLTSVLLNEYSVLRSLVMRLLDMDTASPQPNFLLPLSL
ncbi:hypothetical protein CapIbe_000388 [Capra ibex]